MLCKIYEAYIRFAIIVAFITVFSLGTALLFWLTFAPCYPRLAAGGLVLHLLVCASALLDDTPICRKRRDNHG